jgi:hypothetical protein
MNEMLVDAKDRKERRAQRKVESDSSTNYRRSRERNNESSGVSDGDDEEEQTPGVIKVACSTNTNEMLVDAKDRKERRAQRKVESDSSTTYRRSRGERNNDSDASDGDDEEEQKPGVVNVAGVAMASGEFSVTQPSTQEPTTSELPLALEAELAPDTDAVLEENDKLKRELEEARKNDEEDQFIVVDSVPVSEEDLQANKQGCSRRALLCSLLAGMVLVVVGVAVGLALKPDGGGVATLFPTASPSQVPSPAPTAAPSPFPTQSMSPSNTPTFNANFPQITDLEEFNSTNLAFSQDGSILAVLENQENETQVVLLRKLEEEWVSYGEPIVVDLEVVQIDILSHATTTTNDDVRIVTLVIQNGNNVSVHRYDPTSLEWKPLGETFTNITKVTSWGGLEGDISVKLAFRETGNESPVVVMAIGTTFTNENVNETIAAFGAASIYEFLEASNEWNITGESIPGHQWYSYDPMAIRFADNTNIIAIGQTSEIGSGSVKVYQKSEPWRCGSYWCQLGDVIDSGGDYEDKYGIAIGLSEDGERLAIGAPGDPQCGSDACYSVYTYYFSGFALTPRWLPLGQRLQVKPESSDDNFSLNRALPGFGALVDLSNDGNTLAVMRLDWSANAAGVYVYEFSDLEDDWARQLDYEWDFEGFLCPDEAARSFSLELTTDADSLAFSRGNGVATILHG